ncbi:helix-turn-helix transcriptional regulator [Lachnospiraceae bacterium 46-15]
MTKMVLKFISILPIRSYRIMKGNFVNKLKQLREKRNMSQKALGDAVGITATSISRYEIGKRKLSVEMAKKIARALDVGWTVLYSESDVDR